ncbi:hypothetical protein [Caballeronia arationis]|uniref:hypothetical protein n=1 Tax=Caballeronia arationis TaxID=1777142 RepID=UPI001198243E|nr:hypothetical protein [Caballeronia arationis]
MGVTEAVGQKNEQYGYSAEQVRDFEGQIRKLRNENARLKFDLGHLAGQLTMPRAQTFANQGLGRRLQSIERCVVNIFALYPPGRREFLSHDECCDVGIQFQAFAMNVYALFDNVTWVCLLEAKQSLAPKSIGLFKKACRPFIPPNLAAYLDEPETTRWFHEYGTLYRDSTAHRIAPYLPSRTYTPDEGKRWKELQDESIRAMMPPDRIDRGTDFKAQFELIDRMEREKAELGRNSLLMCLSLTGEDATPPVYLHPQLVCDWGLAQETVRHFIAGMRETHGWQAPYIPPLEVRD